MKVSGYCGRWHRWHHRYVSDTAWLCDVDTPDSISQLRGSLHKCVQSAPPFIAMLEMKKKLESKNEPRQNDASFTITMDNKLRAVLAQMECD